MQAIKGVVFRAGAAGRALIIWDKMRMSDMVDQGESPNCDTHETKRREALINWLMVGEYDISRDNIRGFANEYSIILQRR